MKTACLQFNPILGAVKHNISVAEALLESVSPGDIDLLVLPELAFTGYNFPGLEAIKPYLEPTSSGPTTAWAIETARRLACHVIAGYPETWTDSTRHGSETLNFNATVTVNPRGEVVAHYRKSFLYYTDETWASEGHIANAPNSTSALQQPFFVDNVGDLGKIGHGICMDINPYRFTTPWMNFEFASTMLTHHVRLVILSMAWLTHRTAEEISADPSTPDMETVAYWRERFLPFIDSKPQEDIIVVFANRCGTEGNWTGSLHVENGMEIEEGDRVCYAGSSCVMRFQGGQVKIFQKGMGPAILGKGEEGLLVVDTKTVSLPTEMLKVPTWTVLTQIFVAGSEV